MTKLSVCLFAFSLLAAAGAQAETLVWKTEPFADACQEAAGPKLDKDGNMLEGEHDFVLHKCVTKYGPVMWLMYQDSVRMSIGFGKRPTFVQSGASLNRPGDWPIEWGGTESKGAFKPQTATVRFQLSYEPEKSQLFVYKIAGDEPACLFAAVDPGPDENERARKIAESINAETKCETAPDSMED